MKGGGASRTDLRNFGLIVGAIFAGLFGGLLPWHHRLRPPWWPWALGLSLIAAGALAPQILRYPYLAWERLGQGLGWINSRIVLNLMFFVIFLPAAWCARLTRWDPMKRKLVRDQASYRVLCMPVPPSSMEKPY